MFSIFLRYSICSVTKENLNSGLGLIAVDHNTAGRSALENLAANHVNWRSLELLHELCGECRSNATLDLMTHSPFLVYSGRRSLLCYP